jgi:hypothetical protein
MGKVQKSSKSECCTLSSESFRIYQMYTLRKGVDPMSYIVKSNADEKMDGPESPFLYGLDAVCTYIQIDTQPLTVKRVRSIHQYSAAQNPTEVK